MEDRGRWLASQLARLSVGMTLAHFATVNALTDEEEPGGVLFVAER